MGFRIAIVGRPNVGKSTLFNRLAGRRVALVHDRPGVTRDRREGQGGIADMAFTIIDTAGLEDATDNSIEGRMRNQTERAIAEADVVLFLIDARAGVTPLDAFFAGHLRKSRTPVILVANKCEGKAGAPGLYESFVWAWAIRFRFGRTWRRARRPFRGVASLRNQAWRLCRCGRRRIARPRPHWRR